MKDLNVPNKLTILRIVFVILLVLIAYMQISLGLKNILFATIFAIASFTDYLDGKLARKNNQITDFGKFLDPLADKILVLAAMIILVSMNKIPAWIPIVVITREFAVSGYRLIASTKKGNVVAASFLGKVKTTSQMIGIFFMFLSNSNFFDFIYYPSSLLDLVLNFTGSVFLLISVIATIVSGYNYLKNMKDIL